MYSRFLRVHIEQSVVDEFDERVQFQNTLHRNHFPETQTITGWDFGGHAHTEKPLPSFSVHVLYSTDIIP